MIFSTVAEACCNNKDIIKSDIICLAASDQVKNKRTLLYSVALGEIKIRIPEFHKANDIKITTENGTVLTLLSKVNFNKKEKDEIKDKLLISK